MFRFNRGRLNQLKALSGFKECAAIIGNHLQTWGNMGLCYAFMGEKLSANKYESVEYYKDFSLKNKSYIQSVIEETKSINSKGIT